MDVGDDTSLSNGHIVEESVELLVVADCKLDVTGDNPDFLVVSGGISSQLKNLSCEVFLKNNI